MFTSERRIVVIGYNAFDVVVPVTRFPVPDCKTEVERIILGGGGPGATAAVALARFGATVRLITVLTDDLPGQMQRRELEQAGVDVDLSQDAPGHDSAMAVILADPDSQERTIFWSRGDLPLLDSRLIEPQWLEETDLLYCDGHECHAAILLANEARDRGLPVVMDAGSVREGSRELVAKCSDVISSENFAPDLSGKIDPVDALHALGDLGPSRVAMTFGPDGVLSLVDDCPLALPAFDVPVLDTTGAGDVFHAGYAYALVEGMPFKRCLEFGSAAAALKCRGWGGRKGLPDLVEVEDLIRTGTRRPLGLKLRKFPSFGN